MKKDPKILVGAALLSASVMLMGCDVSKVSTVYGPPTALEDEEVGNTTNNQENVEKENGSKEEIKMDENEIEGRPEDISEVYGPPEF